MLKEQFQKEINQALKSGDQTKRLVLGMLLNSIKNKEISKRTRLSKTTNDSNQLEKQSQLNDDEVLEVIASEVKKHKEAIEQFTAGGRNELAQKEKAEMAILLDYLPSQAGRDEIRAEVKKTIAESGLKDLKDMGRLVGGVIAKFKGRADGGLVSEIVREELQNLK